MSRILIIEDDPSLTILLEKLILNAGYQVYTADNGAMGLRQFYSQQPDLVILDLMLPNIDGWQVFQKIRELADVPIMILTARQRDIDIIRGFELGADDYVTKPFVPKVLLGRIQAVLRRTKQIDSVEMPAPYQDHYLAIDPGQVQVMVCGEPIKVTGKEYKILTYLLAHAGQVLTIQQILKHVWGWTYQDNPDYVHVYISKLRQKLEPDPKNPVYLITEHGMGYQFVKQPTNGSLPINGIH